jgi:hypothetical protein
MAPDTGGPSRRCPLCGTEIHTRHCKLVCPNHGVIADCSDPFWF